jgi:hypothetical protein
MVAFEPKPHDNEVDRFDVCIPNTSANTMLTLHDEAPLTKQRCVEDES